MRFMCKLLERTASYSIVLLIYSMALALPATAGSMLKSLVGAWSGAGQVRFSDGTAEAIRCRAYYRQRSDGIGLSLRCASSGFKVEIRSVLQSRSGVLRGSWEERTYNAVGKVRGRETVDGVALEVTGGGFDARMNVAHTNGTQVVKIATVGTEFQAVNVRLVRLR